MLPLVVGFTVNDTVTLLEEDALPLASTLPVREGVAAKVPDTDTLTKVAVTLAVMESLPMLGAMLDVIEVELKGLAVAVPVPLPVDDPVEDPLLELEDVSLWVPVMLRDALSVAFWATLEEIKDRRINKEPSILKEAVA
jgi:hypothetical protein